jgi:spore germination protein YaaH
VDPLVLDALHLGLQVGTNGERSFHTLIALLPNTPSAIARKTRFPGVAILVSSTEGASAVASRGDVTEAGSHDELAIVKPPYPGLRSSAARESAQHSNINNATAAPKNKGSGSIEAQLMHHNIAMQGLTTQILEKLQRQQVHPRK